MEVHNTVQEAVTKTILKKKKCKKANQLSQEALQIAEKRSERQERRGKIYPTECRVQTIARTDKKAFLSGKRKEIKENNKIGKTKITADGDCSHEIKRHLFLGTTFMTNLDSILKSRDITLPTKVYLVKAMVFPCSHVWM